MFQPNMLSKIIIFKNSKILYLFNTEWNTGKKRVTSDEQVIEWAHARGLTNGAHLREESTVPSCDHTHMITHHHMVTHDEQ